MSIKKNLFEKLSNISDFEKLSNISENNPQELWKILNSFNPKKCKVEECGEPLFNYHDTMVHFQNQGMCIDSDINFKNKIQEELKIIEKDMSVTLETDKPITCSEIKEVLSKLKKGKASGPGNIVYEVIKYSSPVTLNSYVKLFNIILKTDYYPKH
ncbi:unnamed protein product [Mytilus coruscus]|uniref:Uncharacterized protein n=1 Tax=Mytilus coruscus TaxID=42192 RepID=A0A6J8DBW7_MYTCO|nr:unnamed protein product [Mytilus coruscus]